jgi:four helix bundle protein
MEHVPYDHLLIWQKGMDLAVRIYKLTRAFPKDEMYGLTSQLRRSSSSIPANIAEGSKRATKKDFGQFIHIARGSLAETKTHLRLAQRIGLLILDDLQAILRETTELSKMLRSFHQSLL